MKALKLTAIAAAVAAVAASGSALALTNGASGNSSLILTIVDSADAKAYTFDLGSFLNDWTTQSGATGSFSGNALTSQTYSLTDSAFTTFLSGISTTNLAALQWSVSGWSNLGTTAVGNTRLASTVASGSTFPAITGVNLLAAGNNLTAYVNTATGTGPGYETVTPTIAYANVPAANYGASGAPSQYNTIGTASSFVYMWNASTKGTANASTPISASGTWNLQNVGGTYTLTYAVPEPGTWALFAAGLLSVGAIARRRFTA